MFNPKLKFSNKSILVGCLLTAVITAGCATAVAEPDPFDIDPIVPNKNKLAMRTKPIETVKTSHIDPLVITKMTAPIVNEVEALQIEPIESTSYEISPLPREWKLHLGKLVGMELQEWAKKDGWTVVWQVPKDWNVAAETTFKGDFKTASSAVINSLANSGAIIRAQYHDLNHTLVITGPGVAVK